MKTVATLEQSVEHYLTEASKHWNRLTQKDTKMFAGEISGYYVINARLERWRRREFLLKFKLVTSQ